MTEMGLDQGSLVAESVILTSINTDNADIKNYFFIYSLKLKHYANLTLGKNV